MNWTEKVESAWPHARLELRHKQRQLCTVNRKCSFSQGCAAALCHHNPVLSDYGYLNGHQQEGNIPLYTQDLSHFDPGKQPQFTTQQQSFRRGSLPAALHSCLSFVGPKETGPWACFAVQTLTFLACFEPIKIALCLHFIQTLPVHRTL